MKRLLFATLLCLPIPALADDCRDRVVKLVIDSMTVKPSQGHLTSEIKGGQSTENTFEIAAWDHMLFKSIKPANAPWTLTYKGAMYQSSDAGKSWRKVHSFDAKEQRAIQVKNVTAQANSARNAVCGEEALNGVMHDVLEADMTYPKPRSFDIHSKYWVNRNTGFVSKAVSRMSSKNFESVTTQTWMPAEGLVLPLPK